MHIYMLSGRDKFAVYKCASERDVARYGMLDSKVILPSKGDPLLLLTEGFGDANLGRSPMKKGDFHTAYSDVRLFSQRAVEQLGERFRESGRFFPVAIEGREEKFFWYWCTTVVDCLDESRTKRGPPSSLPLEKRLILSPAFVESRVGDAEIFVVPGQSRQFDLFVSEAFRSRIESAGLAGFQLAKSRFDNNPWVR